MRRRTAPLERAADAPQRAIGGVEPVAAPLLPLAVTGTDPTTVRMQERFVETLAAAAGGAAAARATEAVRRSTAAPSRPARPAAVGASIPRSAAAIPTVPSSALPERFRPLTSALVARRVRIAHGSASRAALRSVGRPAATLGNVVHLASAPDGSVATRELLAHELVHAANAPTRPRFYAEPGHDAEEHHANSVGRLARTVRPSTVPATAIRRSTGTPVLPRVVQRVEAPTPSAPAPTPAPEPVVQRAVAPQAAQRPTVRRSTANPVAPKANGDEGSTSATINDLESLIDILERRILLELERRGGRARGGW